MKNQKNKKSNKKRAERRRTKKQQTNKSQQLGKTARDFWADAKQPDKPAFLVEALIKGWKPEAQDMMRKEVNSILSLADKIGEGFSRGRKPDYQAEFLKGINESMARLKKFKYEPAPSVQEAFDEATEAKQGKSKVDG